jgi:hypothetical protein
MKDAQPVFQIKDRDCRFRRERHEYVDPHPTREILILPDGRGISKWGRGDLQKPNPSGNARQVAQEIIAWLDVLDGPPAPFTETRDSPTRVEELLPGRTSE